MSSNSETPMQLRWKHLHGFKTLPARVRQNAADLERVELGHTMRINQLTGTEQQCMKEWPRRPLSHDAVD